ncbi:rhomboid family intramembrane serine protease [Nocardioides campestrisoli]|uniref:rhomboid family intramembrane serine protease n=1 Tax=Nocardioides campestrisoli TaxID=2736757 RepID=UPI001C6361EE|nr:rhomboid family intramembrane serine protease [Nocardioides campestrisoli]
MSEPAQSGVGVPTCYRHPDRETWIRCQRCERPICPDCMRDAAVGFQCPECVAEGARTTRAGQATYGGRRSHDPRQTTIALIAINLAVWVGVLLTGARSSWLADRLMLLPQGRCETGGGYYPGVDQASCATIPDTTWVDGLADGSWWMAVTHGFVHVDVWHIALNCLGLWVLGPPVEAALGRVRFLAVYLLSTLTAGATIFWLADPGGSTLGASGGVFGLMGALAVLALKVGGDLRGLLWLLGINLVFTVTFPGISWQGHLGGLLGGALGAAMIVWSPRGKHRGWWQAAGFAATAVLLAVAFATRAAMLS